MRAARRTFLIDLAWVVVFVVIGRRSHDEGSAVPGALKVMAPFAIGLILAWFSGWRAWSPRSAGEVVKAAEAGPSRARLLGRAFAVRIWIVTVVMGLGLRRLVFDRSIAVSFVIVATLFLGLAFIGWRIVANRWQHRRSPVGAVG